MEAPMVWLIVLIDIIMVVDCTFTILIGWLAVVYKVFERERSGVYGIWVFSVAC
jgi:hypothetical protein